MSEVTNTGLSLSIIIMAYNEENNLSIFHKEICKELADLNLDYEIIIINDGSTDGTQLEAENLVKVDTKTALINLQPNQGLGGVYRTGFKSANNELVTFFPADGQFPASIIPIFFSEIKNKDMILGYLISNRPSLLGRLLSFLERCFYRILLGPMPKFQGILMFRKELLKDLNLVSSGRGWAVLIEFILKSSKKNIRIAHQKTEIRNRLSGHSKVNNFKTIYANFKQVIELAYKIRFKMEKDDSH